jgi:hypothetical protein
MTWRGRGWRVTMAGVVEKACESAGVDGEVVGVRGELVK